MMFAVLLLQVADVPGLPAYWSQLAPLHYRVVPQVTPPRLQYVATEVAARHCAIARPTAEGRYSLDVDIAMFIGRDGTVRRVIPRAIGCTSVEQYSAGLATSFARDNIGPGVGGDRWYRTTVHYAWSR